MQGKPSKPELLGIVSEFFPYKDEKDMSALKDALDRDVPKKKGAVKWRELFEGAIFYQFPHFSLVFPLVFPLKPGNWRAVRGSRGQPAGVRRDVTRPAPAGTASPQEVALYIHASD